MKANVVKMKRFTKLKLDTVAKASAQPRLHQALSENKKTDNWQGVLKIDQSCPQASRKTEKAVQRTDLPTRRGSAAQCLVWA